MSEKHERWVEGMSGDYLLKEGVAYVSDNTHPLLDWITLDVGAAVNTLKEIVNGIPTDVLPERGLTSDEVIPTTFPYVLKSTRGAGFCEITLSVGNGLAFRVQPNIP